MSVYPKIQSVYKREEKTHAFIIGEFSLPEFEYLQYNIWTLTEKIDGTNVRIIWDLKDVYFRGKSDAAQLPEFLLAKLKEIFTVEKFQKLFPNTPMTLYGEGYGAKILKGGKYISHGVDFILFDIKIDKYWLLRNNIEDIASKLNIQIVPLIGEGTIHDAIQIVKEGFRSKFGDFLAEGIVLKPKVEMLTRSGDRIITKVKHKDFKIMS